LKSHVVPEEDVYVPETHVWKVVAAAAVESELGRGAAEKISASSNDLLVNSEPQEPEEAEAVPIPSSIEIPGVNVPITAETEPESRSTNFTSDDQVSTLELEERHALPSPENPDAANVELDGDSIPPEPRTEFGVTAPETKDTPDIDWSLRNDPSPVLGATVEPSLPTSIEQDLPTTTEQELDTAHSNDPATIAEDSSNVVLHTDVTSDVELQSEVEQETRTPSTRGTVSSSKDALTAVVAHEVETEAKAETQGTNDATSTNALAAEFPETEQPVAPTTEVFISYSCRKMLADPVLPK
jgi:hypothetical protein